METKLKTKGGQVRFLIVASCVLAASLVLAVGSGVDNTRKFKALDSTTRDQRMSNPSSPHVAPVPCSNESMGIQVKCSSNAAWTTISDSQSVTCGRDNTLDWRDKDDHDNNGTVSWSCQLPKWAVSGEQIVEFTGELSNCETVNAITPTSTCEFVASDKVKN